MKNSEKIRSAIVERKDVLSFIKKLTVMHRGERGFLSFFEHHNKLLKLGKIEEKNSLFYCGYDCWCYVFEGNEDEVCEKIRELKQKKTVLTPESVLTKMVSSRLINLQNLIDETNKCTQRRIDWMNTLPEEDRHKYKVIDFIDDLEFKDVENNFVRFKQIYSSYDFKKLMHEFELDFKKLVIGLQLAFKKPKMTPEITKKAWDILLTHKVMNS